MATADGRLDGLGPQAAQKHISRPKSQITCQKCVPEAVPMGRGAHDAYRRVPQDVSDPPGSTSTVWGEESTESRLWLQFKFEKQLIN